MNETETFTIFSIWHYMILQKMSIFIQNNAKISQSIKGLREPNPSELELTTASCVSEIPSEYNWVFDKEVLR